MYQCVYLAYFLVLALRSSWSHSISKMHSAASATLQLQQWFWSDEQGFAFQGAWGGASCQTLGYETVKSLHGDWGLEV